MGRKKNEVVPKDFVAMDKMKVDRETADRLYGDGLPFDLVRVETIGKTHTANWAQEMVEAGRCCLWIKAYVEHGEFLEVLKRMGISQTGSWFAMRAAQFATDGLNYSALNNLNSTKFKLLSVLEEPVIEEYIQGGDLGDIPHDDVARMTTRELEAEVRKLRKKLKEDIASREKVISEKEDKINEMDKRLRGQEPPTQERLAAVSLEPLKKKLFEQVLLVQFHLDEAVKAVVAAQKVEGATFPQLQEWAMTHYGQLAPIGELFEELDQALVNCGPYNPESTGM